jgi:hypothetical protein
MAAGLRIAGQGADIGLEACCDGKFNIVCDVAVAVDVDVDVRSVNDVIESNIIVDLSAVPGRRYRVWNGYQLDCQQSDRGRFWSAE